MKQPDPARIAVDIGGTFTDIALDHEGSLYTAKTLTTQDDPVRGVIDVIRIAIANAGCAPQSIGTVIHGTTLATNALIERKGARVGLITTAGFRDIIEIAYERRYDQYDIFIDKPDLLVTREDCWTVPERIDAGGQVLQHLDSTGLDKMLKSMDRRGIESIAICLLHSYLNPAHELALRDLIQQRRPGLSITLSCEVCPEIREFDRACTALANAYIRPLMARYLNDLSTALIDEGLNVPLFIVTSGGGMTTLETATRFPIRLVESGPSGGAVLAARIARECNIDGALSFDMGGTTAKLCLIDQGKPQRSRQFEIGRAARFVKGSGLPVRIPVVEMIEIGAGGGSISSVDSLQRLQVGPESAGSDPGPACYGHGGERPTVTDADVALGFIDPKAFAEGRVRLYPQAARKAIRTQIGIPLDLSANQAAYGISQMVDENMSNAARVHAVEHGKEISSRSMIAFGGNGPLHATRVAQKIGVNRIIIPRNPGVGSAVGFLSAPISYEIIRSLYMRGDSFDVAAVRRLFTEMEREGRSVVQAGAAARVKLREQRLAFMRYQGQGHEIEIPLPAGKLGASLGKELRRRFDRLYREQYGRTVPNVDVEIINWAFITATPVKAITEVAAQRRRRPATASGTRKIYWGQSRKSLSAPCYQRESLEAGDFIAGPALIIESQTTTLVGPGFDAVLDRAGNIVLTANSSKQAKNHGTQTSAVELQVMWNRLTAVVDEQAQALMHTAFSPIVRESGDISAGVFDVNGDMLAQAVTGTPGHINTMAESVKHFLKVIPKKEMAPGDTFMTNDPWLGSGHLNDFVLVQPCFHRRKLVGLVSCTSHLIDLGGLGMGPDGSDVYDEGLIIPPIRLVAGGNINETLMTLVKSNSRTPFQNEGDIYALIACCDVAHTRLDQMMGEFGIASLASVGRYIHDLSRKASVATIDAAPQGSWQYRMMIDGYDFEIELVARLTIGGGEIQVDFDGSSGCSRFGINVPLNYATAYSVFGLRCIFAPEVPNNAGSLAPFRVSAPPGCIVNATRPVPVAQRHIIGQLLPDVVFGCLRQAMPDKIPAEGASCMYDLPMRGGFDAGSNEQATRFAVELTHNGGTGARPGKDGLSATAFPSGVYGSQVEVTESTAPLLVHRRELRPDSGGAGRFRGGLGQIIEIESHEGQPFDFFGTVDRVKYPARGCFGGADGAPGRLALRSGKRLQGKGKQRIAAGESLVFQTPGGGGYGDPRQREPERVAGDYAAGLVSRAALKRDYGVILKSDGKVDEPATRKLRRESST